MSHVADAFQKVGGILPDDPVPDLEHPWGDDLSADLDSREGKAVDRRRPRELDLSQPDPGRPDAATAIPIPKVRRRPIALRSGGGDKHLLALIERVFLPISGEPTRSVAFLGLEAVSRPITAMAAEMLARQTGASVCVVDANFASPSLHEHFGVAMTPGLAQAIDDSAPLADVAREVRPNLWLVSAGTVGRGPSFTSEAVRLRIAQFIASFDYVLADLASVTSVGEEAGLAPLLGSVILVVAAGATRRESARRAAEIVRGGGAAVIGAVLTNRRFPIPEALYRRL